MALRTEDWHYWIGDCANFKSLGKDASGHESWTVRRRGGVVNTPDLGEVRWSDGADRYLFFPAPMTFYGNAILREIAQFLHGRTGEARPNRG